VSCGPQGVYEPQELAGSKVLDKLARRVAPPTVKQHAAAQATERERRERAWRDEQAAKLAEQRAKLAAGETIRCECCLQPITSPSDTAEKHGTLVHKRRLRTRVGQRGRARRRRPGGGRLTHAVRREYYPR
jgi:hypothetical protein